MDGIRITFIVIAVLNIATAIINGVKQEHSAAAIFQSAAGWFCAIIYAV